MARVSSDTYREAQLQRIGGQALRLLAWGAALVFCVALPLWEAPKNLGLAFAAAALLAAWLWGGPRLTWDGVCWGLLAYIGTRLLSAAFAADPAYSLAHAMGSFPMLAAYLVFLNLVSDLKRARLVASLLLAATMFGLLWGFARHRGPAEYLSLCSVGLGNDVGMYLALAVALPAALLSGRVKSLPLRLLAASALLLFLVGLGASLCRGAIMAAVVFFVWLAFVEGYQHSRLRLALITAGLTLALMVTLHFFPGRSQLKLFHPIEHSCYTAGIRASIWSGAWRVFLAHPWLGCGPGNYAVCAAPVSAERAVHAHQIYLQALSETGIVGLAGLLAFLALAVREMRRLAPLLARGEERAYLLAATGTLLVMLVMGMISMAMHAEHALLLVSLLGLAAGLARAESAGSCPGSSVQASLVRLPDGEVAPDSAGRP